MTPKSTFDPDLPSVYWQLAVEAPAAAANLNTGRIAIALTPTSSDYYAKAAWTDRAPLMVQTRIVDSFENTRKIVAVARESIGIRANYVLQPDLRNFEALYYYGKPPIVRVRIIAKLVRMPDRQIIGVASFERCVRARADTVPKVVEAFDQALGSVIKRLVAWTLAHAAGAPAERRRALQHRALPQPGQRRDRQRELPQGQRRLDGAGHRRVGGARPLQRALWQS